MQRLRRLRQAPWVRELVAENAVSARDLVWPVFVIDGDGEVQDIPSMPNVQRYSIDRLIPEVKKARDLGIPAIAIFPVTPPKLKTADGAEAYNPENLMCRTLSAVKAAVPDIGLISDVALDPYTSHGHDGLLDDTGMILNDETVDILCKQALVQAAAGADIIAPSDMMDGRIGKIRAALDSHAHENTMILSYAVKYASAFYGPFRDAVTSSGNLKGDKKTYQMNPANRKMALRETALDVAEGADMLMVKPGLPYLDVIRDMADHVNLPVFGYHVSGEFSMLKAAAANGWLDYDTCIMEKMVSFKRAGCTGIFTYAAREIAEKLA